MEALLDVGGRQIVMAQADEAAEIITVLEALAVSEGWQPEGQLQAYRLNSVYFAVFDHAVPVGGLQLVVANGTDRLPSRHVWPEIDLGTRTDVGHVTLLVLAKPYRGAAGLFLPLCIEMWRYCSASGINHLWMEATPPMLRLYLRLGWPLEIAGPLRRHWGEDCYLCRMSITAVAERFFEKAERSPTYGALVSQALRDGILTPKLTAASAV